MANGLAAAVVLVSAAVRVLSAEQVAVAAEAGVAAICRDELSVPGGVSLLQREVAGSGRGLRLEQRLATAAAAAPHCDFDAKELDIVVYGATGFTGGLASRYLAKDHPGRPRWAIGGRHKDELDELQAELAKLGSNPPSVIVADLDDPASLQALVSKTKMVMSFAGPYRKYGGEHLIEAAVAGCAHYADLCGEAHFKEEMMRKYGELAKSNGVVIMQSVGMDSLPADLLSIRASELVAADGRGPPTDVTVLWSKFNTFFSGGTFASATDQTPEDRTSPYSLAPEAPASARVDTVPGGTPPHTTRFDGTDAGYDANFSSVTFPYVMGVVDGPTVRRSLTLTYPGAPIHFAEVMSESSLTEFKTFVSTPAAIREPLKITPKAGDQVPSWVLTRGGLTGQGLAARPAPNKMEARVHLNCVGDPSYNLTSQWSVDVALDLAQRGPEGGVGGYLTPTLALGTDRLAKRIVSVGGGGLCSLWTGESESPP